VPTAPSPAQTGWQTVVVADRVIVVKIGTSSLTDERGVVTRAAIDKVAGEVAAQRALGDRVVVVTSGAIAAGLPVLGLHPRPTDPGLLQAASAVGQGHLFAAWDSAFRAHHIVAGQVLLAPLDFGHRRQYLHARRTLTQLLDLGVVPVINENDAIADEEIRFGDNDRLAALVAHLLHADALVLLTDTPGLFTGDPRHFHDASLIEEIVEVDAEIEALAGGTGSARGSGGMASKLTAAKIAAWSGVRAVIAAAGRPNVLAEALAGAPGAGTVFVPRAQRLPARKLWIAFALAASGTVVVDAGAEQALCERGVSLLPAGVIGVHGDFDADDAVEIAGPDGRTFAKGLVRHPAAVVKDLAGRRTSGLPADLAHEVVHRDDLVLLP
jgi:glutamate 5-kinase